jgi:hypothetical protein
MVTAPKAKKPAPISSINKDLDGVLKMKDKDFSPDMAFSQELNSTAGR